MASFLPCALRKSSVVLDTWCRRSSFLQRVRYAHRRAERRESRKEEVIQYQSVNAQPAERVYVWGHAATGALGT